MQVVQTPGDEPLPFPDAGFDLVTSRHPVRPDWPEIARVLTPGGTYLAQRVGPASAFELIEFFLGPLPVARSGRDPRREVANATAAGLSVVRLEEARLRIELFDVGAVVYLLRKCVWWVPGFAVERFDDKLRNQSPFVAHATRHLIEARR